MSENKINEIISTSLEKIKELSETGTVVGEQIETSSGTVIIPVSKVSLGFASGGVDLDFAKKAEPKKEKSNYSFGGGGGTGLTVTPIGFLIVKPDGDVRMLNVTAPAVVRNDSTIGAIGDILEKSPDIIKRLKEVFSKDKTPTEAYFEETEE